MASLSTTATLDLLEIELKQMQDTSDEADAALQGGADSMPVGLRTTLAKLHGNANKLLNERLDAILTGDLTTGRDEARAQRKKLVAECEALIERTEQQIKMIDSAKNGDASAPDAAAAAEAPAPAGIGGFKGIW